MKESVNGMVNYMKPQFFCHSNPTHFSRNEIEKPKEFHAEKCTTIVGAKGWKY